MPITRGRGLRATILNVALYEVNHVCRTRKVYYCGGSQPGILALLARGEGRFALLAGYSYTSASGAAVGGSLYFLYWYKLLALLVQTYVQEEQQRSEAEWQM